MVKKILVVRFSSIGDIVLTSAVVRCIKEQLPEVEVHFLTKASYAVLVNHNPHISKVFSIQNEIDEVVNDLKQESYDFIVDLHNNLRTKRLKWVLKRPSKSFPKLNFKKFLLTKFKVNKMPKIHIVDRYFKAVNTIGVINDQKGLDYFIPEKDQVSLVDYNLPDQYVVYAIGAQFGTKKLPYDQMVGLIEKIQGTVVILGGKEDEIEGNKIAGQCKNVINLSGQLNLNQSASVVAQSEKVITHDTGLMHIGTAFNKQIISIWGNTIPDLGMYPYLPQSPDNYSIHEVENLSCRPCSKIGYQSCPKGHFDCMVKQNLDGIAEKVN